MNELLVLLLALAWIMIGFLALGLFALARQIGILHERISPLGVLPFQGGIKVGEKTKPFELKDIDEGRSPVRIGGEHPLKKDSLVLFISPRCPLCKKLLPGISTLSRSLNDIELIFASDGEDRSEHEKIRNLKYVSPFPYVVSRELGVFFGVASLPYAVYINAEGKVMAKGLVNSIEQLEGLIEHGRSPKNERGRWPDSTLSREG
ncbi:thioredoxin fold domain-containing protein [Candidatus Methylacidiphilum infernorum]|uniref:Methylamine utilization protein n=1 Tax=Methylacidiphilum infernorum (isolate V4) TaxID=481448 RepID=A9QPC4_METI4|nr:thioredoxin fold domain-containing protein [Candidatus Methylacidiphilum infernorum]ABX56582.1 methylamine utilization protein [Methylacidiphilum infernorum V4]ACD84053.1 Methylamine utilization protein mauD, thioredoxin [Methylacidiphilum infernorum V4]